MGLVEKWNVFAKKSIYINDSFEIGCGRLVWFGIICAIQIVWGLALGADPVMVMPALLSFMGALKQKKKKED